MSTWAPVKGNMRKRSLRVEMPRVDTLARYGPSLAAASAPGKEKWWDARMADQFFGKGRYVRKLRTYGRRSWKRRPTKGNGLYTGAGGFWSDLGSKWRSVSGRVGAGLKAGLTAAGYGGAANALTSIENAGRAMGMGDYAVSNDIVDGGAGQGIPTFSEGPTSVCISHKEYISDVFGPEGGGQFQNTYYSLNPGIERTFPWLSQIAVNYEEYTLKQCIFTFRSTVTDFVATNGQVGSIIMATQYNPSDTPFQNKQDAMEYDAAMSGKCSANMIHGVECDPAQLSGSPGKYVRSGPVRADDDLKQYDWGNLNVAISNIPKEFANQALGELWVSYTIELRKPKFFVTRGLSILRDCFVGTGSTGGVYLDQTEYGYAQQCRINGELTQVAPYVPSSNSILTFGYSSANLDHSLVYTFPATFNGAVKVRLHTTRGSGAAGTQFGHIGCQVYGNPGSITPINDCWNGGTDTWTAQLVCTDSGYAQAEASLEFHITVRSPTSAGATTSGSLDNVLVFYVLDAAQGGSASSNTPVDGWQLDIEVYNTGFNYPSSGNLIIMNPVTDLQEQWP